jgi:hypothetical protein
VDAAPVLGDGVSPEEVVDRAHPASEAMPNASASDESLADAMQVPS